MKRINTEHLLTLGMALTADRRAMERRVRGVFARKRSAKGLVALSLILALALGFGAFTTACQPRQATVSDSNAQLASSGNVYASGGNALVSGGNAITTTRLSSKQEAMEWLKHALSRARTFPAPRMEGISFTERGQWDARPNPDNAQRLIAASRFLEWANAVFVTSYTPGDLMATYYFDQSGYRADVWRFDSTDGVLSGALNAKTLALISANCYNEPDDALHPSLAAPAQQSTTYDYWSTLDPTSAVARVAGILGGSARNLKVTGGSSSGNATAGWMIQTQLLFQLDDGSYCEIMVYADEALTPTTLCIYPDADCAEEGVFWRADLERVEKTVSLLSPQDFRKGEPEPDDLSEQEAYAFFFRLFEAAGHVQFAAHEKPKEPSATFYVDASGTRENYWHIEGDGVSFDLTSKTGRMINLKANGMLGSKLGLRDIPYEKMGEKEYEDATMELFAALFGKDAIEAVRPNAVYDVRYCTMMPYMADGTVYEIMYQDGLIVEVTGFLKMDPNTWPSVPEWLKKWSSVDESTGVISIVGFVNGTRRVVPNWLADWVYINNETGEIFTMEW